MSDTIFQRLADGLSEVLSPLERASQVPGVFEDILASVGAPPGIDVTPLVAATTAVLDAKQRIEALRASSSASFDDILAVLTDSSQAFTALRRLSDAGGPYAQLAGLGRDLADLLLGSWLASSHPLIQQLAVLLTLIDSAADQAYAPFQGGTPPIRLPYRIDRIRTERLPALLRDPAATLRAEYDNALLTVSDADAMANKLFPRLVGVLRELGISCR